MGSINKLGEALGIKQAQEQARQAEAYSGSIGQNISATDVLCEGPIHGLVDGAASLYLDNNPALQAKLKSYAPSRNEEGSEKSGTITFSNGVVGTVDDNTFIPLELLKI